MRINPIRAVLFIALLAGCGILISTWQTRRVAAAKAVADAAAENVRQISDTKAKDEQKLADAAATKSNQLAVTAAQREKFLGYINTNLTRNAGEEMVAVACVSESGTMNPAISDALVSHFKREHIKFVSSFFRPTLIKDGLFNDVFNGSKDIFKKLELEQSLDGLLLARQDVQYSKNEALNGVITASMQVQIVTLPVTAQVESQSWTLSAKGAAFSNSDARMQAEERIIKQITENTAMSLNQFSTNR